MIQPVVGAFAEHATWSLRRTIFKPVPAVALAVLILVLYLLGVDVLILLFGGATLYGMFHLLQTHWKHTPPAMSLFLPAFPLHVHSMRVMILPSSATGLLATSTPVSLFALFLTFLKLG